MSKALKRRGFRFVGPTICYAFMQAVGMVNDHVTSVLSLEGMRQALAGTSGLASRPADLKIRVSGFETLRDRPAGSRHRLVSYP